jgi:hypothetical protein
MHFHRQVGISSLGQHLIFFGRKNSSMYISRPDFCFIDIDLFSLILDSGHVAVQAGDEGLGHLIPRQQASDFSLAELRGRGRARDRIVIAEVVLVELPREEKPSTRDRCYDF